MANFSVNQVRHLYVVNACKNSGSTPGTLTDVGDINVQKAENELYFMYKGPSGVVKSDFININNITSIKAIDAFDTTQILRKVEVTLNAAPVAGEDYILKINFKNFFSSGDESQYFKDVAVHAILSMDNKKKLFDAMKAELDFAFSREDGATADTNPYLKFEVIGSGDSAKLVITEKAQTWELGTKKARRIMFDVFCGTLDVDDEVWGTVTDTTPKRYLNNGNKNTSEVVVPTSAIGNGQNIADLEWFCMGERGDQYRNVGWPNVVPTKYVADATKEYHLLEIHYAFTDTGVNSYRTEKEITIAVEKGANYNNINALINAINTIAGTSVGTLS